jgi:phosphoglycerate kinase
MEHSRKKEKSSPIYAERVSAMEDTSGFPLGLNLSLENALGLEEMDFLTLDDTDVKGRTVLARVDINSPIDPQTGEILDDTRIRLCAPTLKELAEKGAKVVVLAHQGRPGGDDFTTLEKHAKKLAEVTGLHVNYLSDSVCPSAIRRIRLMRPGDIMLLENVRMLAEETLKLTPQEQAKTHFVRLLTSVAHVFVNDAFGAAHRSSPSLVGLTEVLPSYAGRLMERELKALRQAVTPEKPCVYVLGGVKFDDSLKIIEHIFSKGIADHVLTGGLVANAFLAAMGLDLGPPNIELMKTKGYEKEAERAKRLLKQYGERISVPIDLVADVAGQPQVIAVEESLAGFTIQEISSVLEGIFEKKSGLPIDSPIYDIGPKTIEGYSRIIKEAKTVVANGPLGAFERKGFERGTFDILRAMAESQAFTIIGGGHLVAAAGAAGVSDKIKHVSTGGGATISFLAGDSLPVVEALVRAKQRIKP